MNPRQTRAIALLAGHGAILVFAFNYYVHILQTMSSPPMMPPLVTFFFLLPAVVPMIGVGISYSALVASTKSDEKEFKVLERMAIGLFALMMLATVFSLFIALSSLDPIVFRNHA